MDFDPTEEERENNMSGQDGAMSAEELVEKKIGKMKSPAAIERNVPRTVAQVDRNNNRKTE